jgi:guanylate kinase
MLKCVFSDGGSHFPFSYKETTGYSIVSETDSEILLQSETNEAKNGAACLYVIGLCSFYTIPCY